LPAGISDHIRKQVIQQWIGGDSRYKVAIDNDLGEWIQKLIRSS